MAHQSDVVQASLTRLVPEPEEKKEEETPEKEEE